MSRTISMNVDKEYLAVLKQAAEISKIPYTTLIRNLSYVGAKQIIKEANKNE